MVSIQSEELVKACGFEDRATYNIIGLVVRKAGLRAIRDAQAHSYDS